MMKISPPAFPTYLADNMAHGMTLRDYFASAALVGFAMQGGDLQQMAEDAYDVANSMMKAREE
jgi:hypothetical protein